MRYFSGPETDFKGQFKLVKSFIRNPGRGKSETVRQLHFQDSHIDDRPVVRKQDDPSDLLLLESEETKQKQQRSVGFN